MKSQPSMKSKNKTTKSLVGILKEIVILFLLKLSSLPRCTTLVLIHSADPQPTAGSDHCFRTCCPSVRPPVRRSPLFKIQNSSENNVHQCRDCGSGQVDHCQDVLLFLSALFISGNYSRFSLSQNPWKIGRRREMKMIIKCDGRCVLSCTALPVLHWTARTPVLRDVGEVQ